MEKEEKEEYKLISTGQFKKDYKKYLKNTKKIEKIDNTIKLLKEGGIKNIPKEMKPHSLKGNWNVILNQTYSLYGYNMIKKPKKY